MKKFTFYGDSWFWGWGMIPCRAPRSRTLQKYMGSNDPRFINMNRSDPAINYQVFTENYNWLGLYLDSLGYEYTVFNRPGSDWPATADQFEDSINRIIEGIDTAPEWHVMFYSLPVRDIDLERLLFSGREMVAVQEELDNLKDEYLLKIGRLAQQHDQKVIIAGGQSVLHKKHINRLPAELLTHVHLLTPCLSTAASTPTDKPIPDSPKYGEFKLAGFVMKEELQHAHPSIISKLHADTKQHKISDESGISNVENWMNFYPDSGHLGPIGHFRFLDMLLKYIEDHK